MGNTKKKQHYVPKAYLRFFLCMPSKKKDGQIKVLFKSENRIITSNINDIAEENHFYTLDSLDDKFYWENYYSQSIEPLLKDTINEINQRTQTLLLQNKTRILDIELKQKLAVTMTYQFLRDKVTRNYSYKLYKNIIPQVYKQYEERLISQNVTIKDVENNVSLFKEILMQISLDPDRIRMYANTLLERDFLIYRIIGNKKFITSDHPVMVINTYTGSAIPFENGIMDTTTDIFYPLTPQLMIAAINPKRFGVLNTGLDGCLFYIDSEKDSNIILDLNQKQYEQCWNQVYASETKYLKVLRQNK